MNESAHFLSIVSPVYRGENSVAELVRRCRDALVKITGDFEIILVEDGSPDGSWEAIERECRQDDRVVGVKLSRNFGQHYAITAGLRRSKGRWVVVMDCDLQDRPEEIERLLAKALEGYDLVFARRVQRADGLVKRLSSAVFYRVLGFLTDTQQDPSIGNFGIYSRKVIAAILAMDDQVKYFPTMVKWVGFRSAAVEVDHAQRLEGKTSYNFKKLLDLAINVILSFSDKPLRLTVRLGLVISVTAFCFALYNVYLYLVGRITVLGFASLIVSLWLLSGIMITLIGMLGLYIGRIFDQTKHRPTFIIDQVLNDPCSDSTGTVSFSVSPSHGSMSTDVSPAPQRFAS
jgi:dolichol-phosphate mannosyltransferase